jgi:hypothetical protein
MSTEHQYTICLKKTDLLIHLSSDDVYFISRQMDKWCQVLMDERYTPVSLPKMPKKPASTPESVVVHPEQQGMSNVIMTPAAMADQSAMAVITIPSSVSQLPAHVELPMVTANKVPITPLESVVSNVSNQELPTVVSIKPDQESLPQQDSIQAIPASQLPVEPSSALHLVDVVEESQPVLAMTPVSVVDPVVVMPRAEEALMSSVNLPMAAVHHAHTAIVNPAPVEEKLAESVTLPELQLLPVLTQVISGQPESVGDLSAPLPSSLQATAVEDNFDAIIESVMQDLETEDKAIPVDPMPFDKASSAAMSNPDDEIEALLNNNMDNLPDLGMVSSLEDLCENAVASSSEDYLLLSAYYLSIVEHQATFSLRQVNSSLVSSGLTPVNHSTLETALSKSYFSMLPDLTGMAEVTEYTLTPEGQQATQALFR